MTSSRINEATAYGDDLLWILHDLDRLDKHRLVHLTALLLAGSHMGFGTFIVGEHMAGRLGHTPEGGTILGRVRPDPGFPSKMNLAPEYQIVFDQGGVCDGRPVVALLGDIRDYIIDTVLTQLGLWP